jgi:hypothetical protein
VKENPPEVVILLHPGDKQQKDRKQERKEKNLTDLLLKDGKNRAYA